MKKIIFVVHEYNFFKSHRIHLAKYLKANGYQLIVACPPPVDGDLSATKDFDYYPLKMKRKGRDPLNEVLALLDIFSLYRKEKPDIVQHFTIKPVVYGTLIGKILRVPRIFNTVTGLGYVYTNKTLLNTITKIIIGSIYKFAMRSKRVFVIFQNPDDRKFFLDHGYTTEKQSTVILGTGVDTTKFVPTPEPSGIPTILFASRMLKDKGIVELVEACELLSNDGITFKLRLCGKIDSDNFSSFTEEEIRSFESKHSWLKWDGPQTNMPQVFADSHIVCLPSYREGVPLALLEAMACGRAIVTTDAPGCREVVIKQQNGFLVPVEDVKSLYSALKELCANQELRKKMAKSSRELAIQHFDLQKINADYLNLYKNT